MRSYGVSVALTALASLVMAEGAWAQGAPFPQGAPPQSGQPGGQQVRPAQQPPPKQAQTPAKRPTEGGAASGTAEAGLRQRVEQLEEQLVDLQVVVGTVESLARSGGPGPAPVPGRGGAPVGGFSSGADAGRIAALETQVQALTSQLEQMAEQLRQLQSGAPRGPSGPAPRAGAAAPAGGGFATTVTPPGGDPIANIINNQERPGAQPQRTAAAQAAAPAMTGSPAGRQQYEQAYSLLLQQNYAAAETGFTEFLQRFPQDELAPNAQFWLGETFFVRNQWDAAAAAFLKVAQSYPKSDKAPDSLAKLAMSMERKGNRPAACRALQELNVRYPNPPAHVRTWETAERRRAGCS